MGLIMPILEFIAGTVMVIIVVAGTIGGLSKTKNK